MKTFREIRTAVREVPEVADRARDSLASLDSGVRKANTTMTVLAVVAVVALALAAIALMRVEIVTARIPRVVQGSVSHAGR